MAARTAGKQKTIIYEQLDSDEIEHKKNFILAQYLESMHKSKKVKKTRPLSSKSYTSSYGSTTKIRKFGSQPSLYEERPKFHRETGKVAKTFVREMGAYSWTPLATRTAVGFGEDPFLMNNHSRKKINRPISAPVHRIKRSGSLNSVDTASSSSWTASLVTSHSSMRGYSKKGYMQESPTLCVHAFQNGSREISARVTAKNLLQLLEEATTKLGLASAARKIFLPDGTQVTDARQLYKDCTVYVTMGETFKDPYKTLEDKERIRQSSTWTVSGIMLPEEKSPGKKVSLSKRMKDLVESQRRRILVFSNGESREGVEIVANRFDEFMIDCTSKLGLNSAARALYDWQGKEVQCFSEVPVLDDVKQQSNGSLLGPLWVTRGERFSPSGSYGFFISFALELKEAIADAKKRLQLLEARENNKDVDVAEIMSMTNAEIERETEEVTCLLEKQRNALKKIKTQLKVVKKKQNEEVTEGSSYKFKHISQMDQNNRLISTRGYRLKIRLNGDAVSEPISVYFGSKDLYKGKKTKEEVLQSFFDMLNCNEGLRESLIGHGRRAEFRRAFLLDGTEMKDVSGLDNDAEVWVSFGESFIPLEYNVIGLAMDKVILTNLWNEKSILQRGNWAGADEKLTKPSLWISTTSLSIDDVERNIIPDTTDNDEKLRITQGINSNRLRTDGLYLQFKKNPKLVLYPEVQITSKGRDQDLDVWGDNVRQWILTQDGTIKNKAFQDLVLSVSLQSIILTSGDEKFTGYAVGLSKKQIPELLNGQEGDQHKSSDSNGDIVFADASRTQGDKLQEWILTPDGYIVSVKIPTLYLTSIHELTVDTIIEEIKEEQQVEVMKQEKKKSSSSDSTDSEKSENDQLDEKLSQRRKMNKKLKKKKKKRKLWNFGSSSSSDSSDSEGNRGKRGSMGSIVVRMKGTSSEDDKVAATEKKVNDDAKDNEQEVVVDLESSEAVNGALKDLPDAYGGEKLMIGVFEMFPDKHPLKPRQRWAVKHDDAASLPSSATLSDKWIRQNLAWPVNEANAWSEDFINGYLLPCAPKLKRKLPDKDEAGIPFSGRPARLKVVKNGEPDLSRAVTVVGPDLSNMTKKVRANLPLKWRKGKEFQDNQYATVDEVEFEQFLDRCTEALNLPFAARRLFDENGKEFSSLSSLQRDQIVFVSSGDAWINPALTYSEQQRRLLLANLATDVSKIRNFISLRDQRDLILLVDGSLQADSRIILQRKPDDDEIRDKDDDESETTLENDENSEKMKELQNSYMTAHQIAHIRSEERLQNMRETLQRDSGVLSDKSTGSNSDEDFKFTNPALARKFSRSMETAKLSPNAFRQWVFHDGFIQLRINKKLVLGVQESDETKGGQDVIICNKKVEDPFQRWILSDMGFIHLKCNPQLVLTVATPALNNDPFAEADPSLGYEGARLILSRRLDCYNGNSHQMFSFDADTGLITAFATDITDAEITAANKALVCTYSVFGSRSIYQSGFIVQNVDRSKEKHVFVCESCGKAIRGKQKLKKIATATQFSCAMGSPANHGINATGSFKCLTSKVDLSTKEAETTLMMWEMQLRRLQKESSVRVIAYELNLAQTTPSVRICARKNGETGDGVIVIGNSINQFLDMATYKLGLTQAARKMYTMDGELITDMSQLLQPYYPELCMPIQRPASNQSSRKSNSPDQDPEVDKLNRRNSMNSALMSESSSDVSDGTFTRTSRGVLSPSGQSLGSEKHVSFAEELPDERFEYPDLEKMDVRVPVDVWISCGEPFISISDSEKRAITAIQEREERALLSNYLEQEKHRLRQLQGRRFSGRTSSQGLDSPIKPVLSREWDEPSKQEEQLEKSIEDLQLHLSEMKVKQEQEQIAENVKRRPRSAKLSESTKTRKLYDLPRGISIKVFPNGERVDRAVTVVASNFVELLDRATSRLDLNSAARRVFSVDGGEVFSIDDIEKNQLVCVTSGEKFVPNKDRRHQIELRASWSRIQRGNEGNADEALKNTSSSILALPAPSSPILGTNAISSRNPMHEESLHVFSKAKTARPKTASITRDKRKGIRT